MTRRLLLLSCSRRKRLTKKPLPAIERYDGPAFRVLRRYLDRQQTGRPVVFILSARWGLIPSDTLLPHYDRRMTAHRAGELRGQIAARLSAILTSRWHEVFVLMGESYFQHSPHARGGEPATLMRLPSPRSLSPRAWG